ncbi:DUF2793 domain-containing protein [Rhodoplanes sp. SY1]|uniref:DUF2793 domain-containing protein n=1 Tax=Rhodoplanes sp. SY1 TaxID=3166646 RepID=UPI0038B57181
MHRLDALVMLAVVDRDLAAPPASPAAGYRYLVKAAGSGAFAGHDNAIAHFVDGGWEFHDPAIGWLCWIADEGVLVAWTGAAWQAVGGGGGEGGGGIDALQNLTRLGLGTAADATNPFAAKLNNALWVARSVAEGGTGDLRYKLSKESAAKTLSLLFQTAYSGRAEIGLAGDDDLRVKVSPDGTTWHDALAVDAASGATRIAAGLALAGTVSPSAIDVDQNDYAPAGLAAAAVMRLAGTTARTLTGLAGGSAGRVLMLHNVGTAPIVLKDESLSSAADNRFALPGDLSIAADAVALLQYDSAAQRWRALAGGTGGDGGTAVVAPLAQCRLAKSGASILLSRHGGRHLFIGGTNEVVPVDGVSLAASGLSAGTLYYVYAAMVAGTMTLEASTTAPAVDATFGHMIKSGDASRSLVGMARPVAGPAFADTPTQRLVRSFFNRRRLHGQNGFTTNRTRASTTIAEVNTEIRIELLVWSDETVRAWLNPLVFADTVLYADVRSYLAVDGTAEDAIAYGQAWSGAQATMPGGIGLERAGLAEGYHYLTVLGNSGSGSTATWVGAAPGAARTTLWCGLG